MDELEPITFAVKFVRTMRKQKTARYTPSLRTSLAIPKLMSARKMRVGELVPDDFITCAKLCTPLEDQPLAEAVARSIVFPEGKEKKSEIQVTTAAESAEPDDPLAGLIGDLADLDLDLDSLNFDDLDAVLDEEPEDELGAFDLFESLYSSANPEEHALGELIHSLGGPAELEGAGARTLLLARIWVLRQLLALAGELTPDLICFGGIAGFGPELAKTCREPWEMAGVLAVNADPGLDALISDLLSQGSAMSVGRALAFLKPMAKKDKTIAAKRDALAAAALARAIDLSEFAELVVGVGEWLQPPDDLLTASVALDGRRSLNAASWLDQQFAVDLRPTVFERWLAGHPTPSMETLTVMATDCEAWEKSVDAALPNEVAKVANAAASHTPGDPLPKALSEAVELGQRLAETDLSKGKRAGCSLVTEAVCSVPEAEQFLPLLDQAIERGVPPNDLDKVVAKAKALGVAEEEVWDRLGKALEQLRLMVAGDAHDADRYQRLVDKLSGIPEDILQEMCETAEANSNLEAMAALLAVAMGPAAQHLSENSVSESLGYKGIGGGRNLLVQWFSHRRMLAPGLKARVKEQAKAALLDQALHWAGSGDGSGEKGLLPQSQSRPFRAGDGLDALDLEATLESIVSSGKPLDQVTEEDLFAKDTSRGKAAMAVLIDISGSMGGGELAVCAIAVLMLLGKLLPEEVALAAFESNTHVMKNFTDGSDLDAVADSVLELEATGGTRVDAAFRWAADQFASVPEAEVRILFLLSDFAFFEGEEVLRKHGAAISGQGARLLAASHGYLSKQTLEQLLSAIGGEHLAIKDINQLPLLLLGALSQIGD